MTHLANDRTWSWQQPVWLALLVASSVALSLGLACATPFAAFAAIAACTLPRRDALTLSAAVWLANQAVGFGCLGYPWTWSCLAWGVALGISALVATEAARVAIGRLGGSHAVVILAVALVAAFVAYEAVLVVAGVFLGGLSSFSLETQGRIFVVNAAALAGLVAIHLGGVALGIASKYGFPRPAASRVA
jgi:hypothetical protein